MLTKKKPATKGHSGGPFDTGLAGRNMRLGDPADAINDSSGKLFPRPSLILAPLDEVGTAPESCRMTLTIGIGDLVAVAATVRRAAGRCGLRSRVDPPKSLRMRSAIPTRSRAGKRSGSD